MRLSRGSEQLKRTLVPISKKTGLTYRTYLTLDDVKTDTTESYEGSEGVVGQRRSFTCICNAKTKAASANQTDSRVQSAKLADQGT